MTDQTPVQDDAVEEHAPDGLADPDDRPDYTDELSPTLLASGEQEATA